MMASSQYQKVALVGELAGENPKKIETNIAT
jgi:hypothetical protein